MNYDPIKAPQINARLEFTFSSKILHYVKYLKYNALAFICTESEATPWPNSKTTGKEATQYWFSTKRLASLTQLYDTWYQEVNGKYIKILPLNIEELLTPLALGKGDKKIGNKDNLFSISVVACFSCITRKNLSFLKPSAGPTRVVSLVFPGSSGLNHS